MLFTLCASCSNCGDSPDGTGGAQVDLEPPNTTIVWNSLITLLKEDRITLVIEASEEDCTFECDLDGSGFAPCSSQHVIEDLSDGPHEILARATDPSGNTDASPASFGWTVDTVPPTVVLTQVPPLETYDDTAVFGFESLDATSFKCALDGGAQRICASPVQYTGLEPGNHVFSVQGVDAAGNSSPEVAHVWDVAPLYGGASVTVEEDAGDVRAMNPADVDGDGDVDVVSISQDEGTLRWHENSGNNEFSAKIVTEQDPGISDAVPADLDGDGDADFVTVSNQKGKVTLYENDGLENFTPTTLSDDEIGVSSVDAADLDGDGDVDVLASGGTANEIAVFLNDGEFPARFQKESVTLQTGHVSDLQVVDVDGNGDQDLVVALPAAQKIVALLQPDSEEGAFDASDFQWKEVSVEPRDYESVSVVPSGTDQAPDLVTAAPDAQSVLWLHNDGEGNFTTTEVVSRLPGVSRVVAADIDEDGDVDVLAGSETGTEFYWLDNQGGMPPAFNGYSFNSRNSRTEGIDLTDVDLDGDADVVSSASGDGLIYIELNQRYDCPPGFTGDDCSECTLPQSAGAECGECFDGWTGDHCAARIQVHFESRPLPVTTSRTVEFQFASNHAVDFECALDGSNFSSCVTPQEVTVETGSHVFRIRGQTEGGYLTDVQSYAWFTSSFGDEGLVTESGFPNQAVIAGDLDFDGDFDLVVASSNKDKIVWYENANGEATDFTAHLIEDIFSDGAYDVQLADINQDGFLDVIAVSQKDDRVSWYENSGSSPVTFTRRAVNTADEDGNASNSVNGDADGARSVFPADLDADGHLDLIVTSFNDDKITWYRHNGAAVPGFSPVVVNTPDVDGPSGINGNVDGALHAVAADFDGDGDLDVASASNNDHQLAWFENVGDQNFEMHVITQSARGAQALAVKDLDEDGDQDLVFAAYYDNEVAWFENDGTGSFTFRDISTSVTGAQAVQITDVDGDGDWDVLAAARDSNKIIVFYNDGQQGFAAEVISDQVLSARDVFGADMDGDGDVDVVTAGASGTRTVWYPNQQYDCSFGFTGEGCSTCTFPQASGSNCDVCSAGYGGNRCSRCLVPGACN